YWAGDRNPELVKLVRRSRGPLLAKPRITGSNFPAVSEPALSIVQRIVCIPRPVPDKVPRPSMKLVAAALERHIDDTAASAPILRVVGGSLDFELPDGVDRRREVVAAPGAIGRAVEKIFIGCRAPAIHRPRRAAEVIERTQSGSPGGPEGRHLPDDADGELVEHEDHAAIQGHRLDLLLVDHLAHASGSRIEQGCVRFDGDRFADRPYFHGYVDCNLLVDLDGDSGLREFAKPLPLDFNPVGARYQEGDVVRSVGFGHGFGASIGLFVSDGYSCAGYRGSRGVCDAPEYRPAELLS